MIFLTTVKCSFEIRGRGACWVEPVMWTSDLKVREKTIVQLRTPAGKVFDTEIRWITTAGGISGRSLIFGFPQPITKHDVPEGTEIWLVEKEAV